MKDGFEVLMLMGYAGVIIKREGWGRRRRGGRGERIV